MKVLPISRIDVKTDCVKYSGTDDGLDFKLCQDVCCTIHGLDNPKHNDYEICAEDSFSGDMLKDCRNFKIDPTKNLNINVEIKGNNGWKGKYMDVKTDTASFHCPITRFVDGNDITNPPTMKLECKSGKGLWFSSTPVQQFHLKYDVLLKKPNLFIWLS